MAALHMGGQNGGVNVLRKANVGENVALFVLEAATEADVKSV